MKLNNKTHNFINKLNKVVHKCIDETKKIYNATKTEKVETFKKLGEIGLKFLGEILNLPAIVMLLLLELLLVSVSKFLYKHLRFLKPSQVFNLLASELELCSFVAVPIAALFCGTLVVLTIIACKNYLKLKAQPTNSYQ